MSRQKLVLFLYLMGTLFGVLGAGTSEPTWHLTMIAACVCSLLALGVQHA